MLSCHQQLVVYMLSHLMFYFLFILLVSNEGPCSLLQVARLCAVESLNNPLGLVNAVMEILQLVCPYDSVTALKALSRHLNLILVIFFSVSFYLIGNCLEIAAYSVSHFTLLACFEFAD